MKKTVKMLSLIMAMIVMLGTFSVVAFADGTASSGTITPDTSWYLENSKYKVATLRDAADLLGFAKLVNDSVEFFEDGWTIKLGADIVFNEGNASDWAAGTSAPANVWTPIYSFMGTFDGQGYTISGLYVNDATAIGCGLFAVVDGATIKNVSVVNSYFACDSKVGAIAGTCSGMASTIDNCYTDAIICNILHADGTVTNFLTFGGIVGEDLIGSTIQNCWFDGTIVAANNKASSGSFARTGGIVAYCNNVNDSTIKNCLVTGSITGHFKVGGIVGDARNTGTTGTVLENCLVLPSYFRVTRAPKNDDLSYGLFAYVSKNVSLNNVYGDSAWEATLDDGDFALFYDGSKKVTVWVYQSGGAIVSNNSATLALDSMKGDAAKTSLVGFDFEGEDAIWATVTDGTPVLKALATIASTKTSGQAEAPVDPNESLVEGDDQLGDQPGDDQPGDDQPGDDQPSDQPGNDDDATDTKAPETKAPETEAPAEEKKGCGGMVTGMSVVAIAMIGAACGMIAKKKED